MNNMTKERSKFLHWLVSEIRKGDDSNPLKGELSPSNCNYLENVARRDKYDSVVQEGINKSLDVVGREKIKRQYSIAIQLNGGEKPFGK